MDAVTLERPVIEGGGTPDRAWAEWLTSASPAALEPASIVGTERRLVVVAPHPDDEILMCGGLLAHHSESQGRCLVLAVTDGEASHPDRPGLGRIRCAERLQALRCLGLPSHCVQRLCFADGAVMDAEEELAVILSRLLRRDDVVIAPWRHDAHPDHEATARVARRVAMDLGARFFEAPVWMWHWASPGDPRVPWPDLRVWNVPDRLVQARCRALHAHVSQSTAHEGQEPVLTAAMFERMSRHREYLFTAS